MLAGGYYYLLVTIKTIFAIAQSRGMVIEEAYRDISGSTEWMVNVTRNLNDWEVSEYEALLQVLAAQQISSGSDQILWKLKQSEEFSVKFYYKHIVWIGQSRSHNFLVH